MAEQIQRGELSPHHAEIQRDDLDKKIKAIKDSCMKLGKYAAIAAATIARVDPNVALRTATTALEENFTKHGDLKSQDQEREEEEGEGP